MVIYGVSFDMVGKQPIVLLKTVDSNKFLPIWIGHPEAAAILMKLQGATTPRPMTHDLIVDVLGELEVKCSQVAVTELRDNTFFASITLSVNGKELEIDSRPSDALALAVRSGAPIFAAEEVIAESAIEFEHEVEDTEEVVDRFKEFLDQVSPEDFMGETGEGSPPGVARGRSGPSRSAPRREAAPGRASLHDASNPMPRVGRLRAQARVVMPGIAVGFQHLPGSPDAVLEHEVDARGACSQQSWTSPPGVGTCRHLVGTARRGRRTACRRPVGAA
jgi:bifunctional DNase/RNase